MKGRIPFIKKHETVLFAQFISQLIREGVTFAVFSDDYAWEVELTGGF